VAYSASRKNILIGDEMGLGKTIQALGVVNLTHAPQVLVVAPAGLRLNWQREAEKWLVDHHKIYVIRNGKDPLSFNDLFYKGNLFVIVNYELLSNKRVRTVLMEHHWDLQIYDEAHYLKTPEAARTGHCLGDRGLVRKAKRVLFLTGTPILNRPIEIYPILQYCMPWHIDRTGCKVPFMSPHQFSARFCGGDGKGASRLEELQAMLRSNCMVRRLKQDVLSDLPPKFRQMVILEPLGAAAEAVALEAQQLDEAVGEFRAMKKTVSEAKNSTDRAGYEAQVGRLREAGSEMLGMIAKLRKATALVKVPYVIEHVKNAFEQGIRKIVLFGYHHDVINSLRDGLEEYSPVVITGETPMVERQIAVDLFQNDTRCQLFIGNFKAAGVGITLTASSHVIFAEIDWTPANITQAEDRTHRIGQVNKVTVQHVLLDGSIDERLTRALVKKQEIADAALDEKTRMDALKHSVDLFGDDEATAVPSISA
jgi:SWI/SNF-related matrix-associated actin-dependent regulator 1 of chromatin subfamily A